MRQDRGLQRHEQLRDAGARVLLAEGYDAVTHRAVAAEAGSGLGTLSHYFADVDDLRAQALERAGEHWRADSRAALDALPARLASRAAVARAALSVVLAHDDEVPSLYERYVRAGRDESLRAPVVAYDRELVALLGEVLQRGGHARSGARLLLAATDGLLAGAAARGMDDLRAEVLRELTRLVGLLP